MDEFEKWFNEGAKPEDTYELMVKADAFLEVSTIKDAWQESAKHRPCVCDVRDDGSVHSLCAAHDAHNDVLNIAAEKRGMEIGRADGVAGKQAEIKRLETTIEILEGSVKSFTDGNVDLVKRERGRIVGMIREWADCQDRSALWVDCYKLVADRIEKG